jgi:tRNA modification GTPase
MKSQFKLSSLAICQVKRQISQCPGIAGYATRSPGALRRSVYDSHDRMRPGSIYGYRNRTIGRSVYYSTGFGAGRKRLEDPDVKAILRSDPSLDTIYALSTTPLSPPAYSPSALAIVRISGPRCSNIYHSLTSDPVLPKPRHATLRTLHDPIDHADILDPQALILRFPGPKSVTGEDVLEVHIHGGRGVVEGVLRGISRCSLPQSPSNSNETTGSIRYAEPGEFTKRAVLHGRMSLSEAESLGDVLSAQTAQQRRAAATRTSQGRKLAEKYDEWRLMLTSARGVLEGVIDFSEDQQFDETPRELLHDILSKVKSLRGSLALHVENAARGEILRNGINIAIIGRPNAGKSSLLNLLVGREAAIVSDERGTTRDVLEVSVDLQGWLCRFVDTAGLRGGEINIEAVGKVEREGIRRAKERAKEADVVIVMLAPDSTTSTSGHNEDITITIDQETLETARECGRRGARLILAINKSDLILLPFHHRNQPEIMRNQSQFDNQIDANERKEEETRGQIRVSNLADLVQFLNEHNDNESRQQSVPTVQLSCKLANMAITPDQMVEAGMKALVGALTGTFKEMASVSGHSGNDAADLAFGASERQKQLLEQCVSQLESFILMTHASIADSDSMGSFTNDEQVDKDEQLDHVDLVLAAECLRSAADCLGKITGKGDGASGDVEDVLGVVFEK